MNFMVTTARPYINGLTWLFIVAILPLHFGSKFNEAFAEDNILMAGI